MSSTTIVVSRSSASDECRAFEDDLISALREPHSARIIVVPSVYMLEDDSPALAALGDVSDDMLVASWLHPRAVLWALRARGIVGEVDDGESPAGLAADGRTLRAVNLASFETSAECAARILEMTSSDPRRKASVAEISGPASDRWYPVIDYSRCTACGQCHDFCIFGVYTLDGDDYPKVTSPDKCKPGCPACARVCPVGAVMFPLYEGDEGISGAPGVLPAGGLIDTEAFFANTKTPCPLCGQTAGDVPHMSDDAPKGQSICSACGLPARADTRKSESTDKHGTDDLDDLIDSLDKLDL